MASHVSSQSFSKWAFIVVSEPRKRGNVKSRPTNDSPASSQMDGEASRIHPTSLMDDERDLEKVGALHSFRSRCGR